MTTKLKPCPRCGAPAERRIRDAGPANAYRKWVECTACTCRTSVHLTEDADDRPADEEWNALPRALTWTTEPPTSPGFYWWQCDGHIKEGPQIAHIKVGTNHTRGGLEMRFIHHGPTYHHCDKCQWAGPIPTPQEPAL